MTCKPEQDLGSWRAEEGTVAVAQAPLTCVRVLSVGKGKICWINDVVFGWKLLESRTLATCFEELATFDLCLSETEARMDIFLAFFVTGGQVYENAMTMAFYGVSPFVESLVTEYTSWKLPDDQVGPKGAPAHLTFQGIAPFIQSMRHQICP
ncbi:Haus Augmin-Like Complex Subunit 5 [Manis pentadactyla]|nr:Haus Augmin-Like Complex Subunit 5 [Manis pentadactyla]